MRSLSGQFGDYNVTTTVQAITAADAKTAPLYNTAEITSGPTDKNGGHSYVKNGNEMHVTMKDVKGQGKRWFRNLRHGYKVDFG